MLPTPSAMPRFDVFCGVATTGCGATVSFTLSSGQATPRSGIGSSGALGSSSAASGGGCGGDGGGDGAVCASNGNGAKEAAAATHSSRTAPTLDPLPLIEEQTLTGASERRQYVRCWLRRLVDGSDDFVAAQGGDDPLDLAP